MSDEKATEDRPVSETVDSPESNKKDASHGDRSKKSLTGNLIFVGAFAATLAAGYFGGQEIRRWWQGPPEIIQGDRYSVSLRGDEPQIGPDDALVTIVEFSDFECPFCAKGSEPFADIVEEYKGEVRVIFKNYPLPFHKGALPAAYAGYAAHQQGKFWEMHDFLFAHRGSIRELPSFLSEHKLDVDQFASDMESDAAREFVDDDHLGGGKAGVRSTPSFLVNGHPYSGARDLNFWRYVVDAEIDAAKDLGVDPSEVYATLMKAAKATRGGGHGGRKPSEARKRRAGEPNPDLIYGVPITGQPSHGPVDALVTIVEFSDYHCPFCIKVKPTIDKLLATYPEDLRVVHFQQPLPMHKHAKDAAKIALAADRQGRFDAMHDAAFEHAGQAIDSLKNVARGLGLDMDRLENDLADPSLVAQIDLDRKTAAAFGVKGTPAFFINGRFVSGAQPFREFNGLVLKALKEAKAKVAKGTPRADLYTQIVAEGETAVGN